MAARPRFPLPFAACFLGIAFFAIMDATVKFSSIAIGVYNTLLWRSIIGAIMGGALMLFLRRPVPHWPVMKLHLLRGGIVSLMAYSFFWALLRLPLAESIALSFIAPLIALYLARLLLGERVTRQAVVASLVGLAGVGIILAGKLGEKHGPEALWGIAAVLFSAMLYAYNLIIQRQQAQISSPIDIAFFQNLFMALVFIVPAPFHATLPPPSIWPMLALSSSLAFISLALIAWAYARAQAQSLIPIEYTAFLWSALIGWLAFGEYLTVWTMVGAVFIIAGSLLAVRGRPDITHVETTAA